MFESISMGFLWNYLPSPPPGISEDPYNLEKSSMGILSDSPSISLWNSAPLRTPLSSSLSTHLPPLNLSNFSQKFRAVNTKPGKVVNAVAVQLHRDWVQSLLQIHSVFLSVLCQDNYSPQTLPCTKSWSLDWSFKPFTLSPKAPYPERPGNRETCTHLFWPVPRSPTLKTLRPRPWSLSP